jgi:hypothetical protein
MDINMPRPKTLVFASLFWLIVIHTPNAALGPDAKDAANYYVQVSPRDARYLELSDGRPYVPIGLNVIHPRSNQEGEGLAQMERWMRVLSENGGNFIRIWLSSPFWDVEHEQAGVYDEQKARRIDALLELARRHGIRVKFTLEHFRELDPQNVRQRWASKQLHHVSRGGTASSMPEWLTNETSRAQFRAKLAWHQKRFGDDPIIFGWELWNEMNAVRGGDYMAWTEAMLPELKRLFPRNMTLQSLGSFDTARARTPYQWLCRLQHNDVAQVHRYLDLGASLEVCRGPVDVLAADSVRELQKMQAGRPIILAEGGAVEPGHSGPFKLYGKDTAGIILHDVLFAPFFAGAAGTGQSWHWAEYVDRNNLWFQFRGFAEALREVDPAAEEFEPRMIEHPRLRVYMLSGKRTSLLWCRDSNNTWHTELQQGLTPDVLEGLSVELKELGPLEGRKVRTYDPWKNAWTAIELEAGELHLPPFTRSIVVRMEETPRPR